MQLQLACMLLLCFTCGTLCSGEYRDLSWHHLQQQRGSDPPSQKKKQETFCMQQSAPYWQLQLSSLCKLVSGVQEGTWSREEEDGEEGEASLQLLEELFNAYACLCAPQLLYDSLEENSDVPLKRKSPYILKRQAGPKAKSRRPYILKRRTVY
uniref:Neurotensin/neuromedin N n=1 Tax=Oryzias melastigma TaxID=30732 RepID=A0A3B3B9R9_ORYME